MQAYDIKRGHARELEGDGLKRVLEEIFGEVTEVNGTLRVSHGAIRDMTAWFDGEKLYVDTNMDREADERTAAETIRTFNAFLERATGLSSKQRRKRLQKKAKEGGL